jgi:choline-sulfatase
MSRVTAEAGQAPPNFLFVMADQLGAHAVPAYGNGFVDAPNLTVLGREGIVFENAYCNSPICAPSRSSMMTGQLPSRVGVYDNGAEMPSSAPTIAHYLRARGYQTCLIGKMHFIGADQLHGFEERLTTDFYPAGFDWTPDWERSPSDRLPWYHDMSSVLGAGVSEATLQTDFDEEVAFRTVRKIYDLARRSDRRPFFLVASFMHPHDPWEIPRSVWERYEGVSIDLPVVPRIPWDQLDPHSRRIRLMCGNEASKITDEAIRTARRGYYAAVSYVDDLIGQLLTALDLAGFRESTIVVLTADHGEMLGEGGLWYKMTFLEPSARVPLLMTWPNRFAPRRVAQPVSLVDLLPTLVELASGGGSFEPADPIDGASMVPLLLGGGGVAPTSVLGEYLAEGAVAPLVMIRRDQYKYIHCPADPDQLYDLASDPNEVRNLANTQEHAGIVSAFRDEAASRWDVQRLHDQVLASQRRRRLVVDALSHGRVTGWDYRPPDNSPDRYVRGQDFWAPFAGTSLRRGREAEGRAGGGNAIDGA